MKNEIKKKKKPISHFKYAKTCKAKPKKEFNNQGSFKGQATWNKFSVGSSWTLKKKKTKITSLLLLWFCRYFYKIHGNSQKDCQRSRWQWCMGGRRPEARKPEAQFAPEVGFPGLSAALQLASRHLPSSGWPWILVGGDCAGWWYWWACWLWFLSVRFPRKSEWWDLHESWDRNELGWCALEAAFYSKETVPRC